MEITTVEIFEILSKKLGRDEAEKLVTYIAEQSKSAMNDSKLTFLTKDDKIDIIDRMDRHFKWLVGIMLSAISLATLLAKLL